MTSYLVDFLTKKVLGSNRIPQFGRSPWKNKTDQTTFGYQKEWKKKHLKDMHK